MGVPKSLRKVKKCKDKPGEGLQVSIRKFLRKVEEVEKEGSVVGRSVNKAALEHKSLRTLSPKKTIKPSNPKTSGAQAKPGLRKVPSTMSTSGPPTRVGGKLGGGGRKEGRRTLGSLEKWLLPLGKTTGHPGTSAQGQGEQE